MAKSLPVEEVPFDLPGDRLDDRLAQGVDGLPRSGLELNLQARMEVPVVEGRASLALGECRRGRSRFRLRLHGRLGLPDLMESHLSLPGSP